MSDEIFVFVLDFIWIVEWEKFFDVGKVWKKVFLIFVMFSVISFWLGLMCGLFCCLFMVLVIVIDLIKLMM